MFSLINSGNANNVLLLTGDTYSKIIDEGDASVSTLFGDGATATLIGSDSHEKVVINKFILVLMDLERILKCDIAGFAS